jgi:hypothetical protein
MRSIRATTLFPLAIVLGNAGQMPIATPGSGKDREPQSCLKTVLLRHQRDSGSAPGGTVGEQASRLAGAGHSSSKGEAEKSGKAG